MSATATTALPPRHADISPPTNLSPSRAVYTVVSTRFEAPRHYQLVAPVGFGAYGFVVSALDTRTNTRVAIKKGSRIFRDLNDCKRMVREIALLKALHHENVICLRDVYLPIEEGVDTFRDVYLVTDLMDTTLHSVIRSEQAMNESHYRFFVYQALRGLKYLHSAGVIHRDLKPANLLVNMNCDLQICDFGLARQYDRDAAMTDYVVTRYYRPPELLLMSSRYSFAVDIWSLGCILAEMVTRRTLFKGSDYVQQLDIILYTLRPTLDDLTFLDCPDAAHQVVKRTKALKESWGERPNATKVLPDVPEGPLRDFLLRMLVFDPRRRAKAEELLAHPFLEELHDVQDEPVAEKEFVWEYEHSEAQLSEATMRSILKQFATPA